MKYGRRNPYFIIAGRQTQGALRSGAGHRSDRDFCSSRIGGNLQSNSPAADDPPYGSTADRYAGSDGGHRDWPFPQGRGFGGSCGGAGNLRELGAATLGSLVHCLRRLLKLLVTRIASRDGFRDVGETETEVVDFPLDGDVDLADGADLRVQRQYSHALAGNGGGRETRRERVGEVEQRPGGRDHVVVGFGQLERRGARPALGVAPTVGILAVTAAQYGLVVEAVGCRKAGMNVVPRDVRHYLSHLDRDILRRRLPNLF